jgi:hypothetical protein
MGDDDYGGGITVDDEGFAYIHGSYYAGIYPDIYIFKLSPDGSTLIYNTVIHGSSWEACTDIYVEDGGYVYITGYTNSPDFPTKNAYSSTKKGGEDVFITKLAPNGSSYIFSTFFGGGSDDRGSGFEIDQNGRILIAGHTRSNNFPIVNAYDYSKNGGIDVFISKFSSECKILINSTFIGGLEDDYVYDTALDQKGDVYVTGDTYSSDFPTNGYDETFNGEEDCFVLKMEFNANPNIPSDPYPLDNSTNIPLNAICVWNGSDPENDTLTYDVYFGTTTSPPMVSSNQSDIYYDPGLLDYNVTYYWQIRAWDCYGEYAVGSLWSFTSEIPKIEIGLINGGLGRVTSIITNPGFKEINNVNWLISLNGGLIISGKESEGMFSFIDSGEDKSIKSGFIIGFGPTTVTVDVWVQDGSSHTREQKGFILIFFIKVTPSGSL